MQLATVVGNATATVKHPSIQGWRLLVVQSATADGRPEGEPLLVVDSFGASRGDTVLISNDGAAARRLLGDDTTPVRWTVIGIPDAPEPRIGQPSQPPHQTTAPAVVARTQADALGVDSKPKKRTPRKRKRRKR